MQMPRWPDLGSEAKEVSCPNGYKWKHEGDGYKFNKGHNHHQGKDNKGHKHYRDKHVKGHKGKDNKGHKDKDNKGHKHNPDKQDRAIALTRG
ncbi:hypothetical protein FALCPG4_015094 [Fusarium falciforme]